MVDATRQMLDELMGKERNVPLNERKGAAIKFYDSQVCKYDLCGLCPYQLFPNTKSDLGPCVYEIHEDHVEFKNLKDKWDSLSSREKDKYGYQYKLYRLLEELVNDMDRKIDAQRRRAEKESQPKELKPEDQQQLDNMQQQINDALEKSQALGEQGDVDGSMFWVQQSETLKQQKDQRHQQLTQPERQMMVCDVCGVFINSTDNEQRRKDGQNSVLRTKHYSIQDHLNGKQYQGWKRIRDLHAQLKELYDPEIRMQKEEQAERERREKRHKADKENGESNGKHKRSSKSSRDRSRSRSHRKSSRKHRSRSRSRHDRSRSRRDKDYDRDRYYDREDYYRRGY